MINIYFISLILKFQQCINVFYLWLKCLNVAELEVDGFPSSGVHVLIGLFGFMAYLFGFFLRKKKPFQ